MGIKKVLTAMFFIMSDQKKRHTGQCWPCVTFFGAAKSPMSIIYGEKNHAQRYAGHDYQNFGNY